MPAPDQELRKSGERDNPAKAARGSLSVRSIMGPALLLTLLVAATYLPFINQAIHIDDTIYLDIANTILRKPLYPYDYPVIFEGYQAKDGASNVHLPLTCYYMAAIKLVTGSGKEWVLHLAFMIFPLIGAWAMYDVARRFVRWPLAVAGLLVVSPAFMTLSHTLMTDVPLLSFWLVALSGFLAVLAAPERRRGWLILGAGLCAASLISLITGLPIVLLAAVALFSRRLQGHGYRMRMLLLLAAPFVIWTAWFLLAYFHYGRFVLILSYLHMSQRQKLDWWLVGEKGLSFVLNLGALFLMPLVAWVGFAGSVRARLALVGFCLAWIPLFIWAPDWTGLEMLLFTVFLATGALVLAGVLWPPGKKERAAMPGNPPFGLLKLWFVAFGLVCLFVYYSGSARYTLPVLPAVVTFWVVGLERQVASERLRRGLVVTGVILTAVYSLWLSDGDYRFAGVYRDTARELMARYRAPGRTVWVAGEWGFRYYMNQAGAKTILKTTTDARPGDIIVKPYVAMPWVTAYDGDEYTDRVEQVQARVDSRIRLLDFGSHAGFYSTGWGILPFSLGDNRRWEWFNVYRVKREYHGPPPTENRPY
jgi:4-amino-4-deoxy-L-arabinose transferase-like glycosyltransferase